MPILKATFFFQQQNQGWTESVYSNLTNRATLNNRCKDFINWRTRVASPLLQIVACRTSDVLNFRDSQYLVDPGFPFSGQLPIATNNQQSRVALGIPFSGGLQAHRTYWLHSYPDSGTNGNLVTVGGGIRQRAINFADYLKDPSNNWCLLGRTIVGARVRTFTSIDAFGLITGPFIGGFVPTDTTRLAIHGVKGIDPQPNRVYKIDNIPDGTHVKIFGWPPRPAVTPPAGTLTVFDYTATAISTYGNFVLRTRKTGRPFDLLRGRQSPDR